MVTAVQTRVVHDWRLVAPWWHWPLRAGLDPAGQVAAGEQVRHSAPVLQKYDGPDFVNTFLADPQHRLAFRPGTDEVHTVTPGPNVFESLPTRGSTGRRKLYLGSHHRQYLVVASLHCAQAGFPNIERSAVCEAGFVVRRYTTRAGDDRRKSGAKLLAGLTAARRRREGAEAQVAAAAQAGHVGALRLGALQARLRSLDKLEREAAEAVRAWAQHCGVKRELQGWVPQGVTPSGTVVPVPPCAGHTAAADQPTVAEPPVRPLAGVGAWQAVTELPELLDEATFPLYPLIADPTRPDHDAAGQTVWFGVVPTGSSDVDPGGVARFDDRSIYEIRCYVRRHRPECPRDGAQCRCPVTWSEPTEPYQLASHFDLEGTANRPITVQLPDLTQLQADAIRLGPGGTGGVRFRYPPGSALPFSTANLDATATAANTDFQICSFSIPLITIVALFVFQLFLPIVVFVFQLWFLLALRFCIPPDVKIDSGGELDLAFQNLGVGLDIDADVAARFGSGGDLADALEEALTEDADGNPVFLAGNTDNKGKTLFEKIKDRLAAGFLDTSFYAALARSTLAQGALPPSSQVGTPADPVFAARVERNQVVAP